MPHISSKRLSEKSEKELESRLVDLLKLMSKDSNIRHAWKELLTPTEILMLAKRLGIIYLITKDKSTLDICETLNVSTSTVIRMQKIEDRGGYKSLNISLKKLEPSLIEILEILFRAGLPPIVGKGRLKHLTG